MAQFRFEATSTRHALAILAMAALLLPTAAGAQDTPAPGAPGAPGAPTAPGAPAWVKVCGQDQNTQRELCQVIQQMTADTGQFIASVNLQTLQGEDGQPNMRLAAAISMVAGGLVIRPGLRAQIDDNEQHELAYSVCYPDHCFADMEANNALVSEMKAGGKLTLIVLTQDRGTIAFPPLTLIGFTRAYDGPGIDPSAAQARLDQLSESLKEHAEEARQRLIDQQQRGSTDPTATNP